MTRILFVEHNLDGTIGGSHYALLEICRGLDRSRFHPITLFFQPHPLLDDFRQLGAEVIVSRGSGGPITLGPQLRLPAGLRRALQAAINAGLLVTSRTLAWARLLRTVRPDIVHLNNSFNGDHDLVLATWLRRIPCLAHQRGVAGHTGWLEVRLGRVFAAVIAISTFIEADLIRRGVPASRVHLIHDGIDPRRVQPRRAAREVLAATGIPDGAPVVGIVGNLKPWKGQHVLIEAVSQLAAARPDLHTVIVGSLTDERYVAELRRLVTRNGLSDRVHLVGYQRHPADFIGAMNVVVHASIEPEPFGLVILEAMAQSKPVIATKLGGPIDTIVDGESGLLTPPGDSAALADRIRLLLDDPEQARRIGEAGYHRLSTHFTAAKNVHSLQALYSMVVERRVTGDAR